MRCHDEEITRVSSCAFRSFFCGGDDGLGDILSSRNSPCHLEVEIACLYEQTLTHALEVRLCVFYLLCIALRENIFISPEYERFDHMQKMEDALCVLR